MNGVHRGDPASGAEIGRLKERLSDMERLVPPRPSFDHVVGNVADEPRVRRRRLSSPLGSSAGLVLAGVIVVMAMLVSQRGPNVPQAGTSPSAALDTSAWVTLAPQGEGFSVLVPCTATPVPGWDYAVVGGIYAYTSWSCTDSSGRAFLVQVSKYAEGALSGPVKPVLDGAEDSWLGQYPAAQVESQSDITLGGHAGRTGVFANSTTRVHGEMVIVGDTIYAVGVSYPVGLAEDGVVTAFMASFQLTV
jgi:hypothetical protein